MDVQQQTHVTTLLGRIREGDAGADAQLLDLVYDEMRGLARAVFANQDPRHTLQPTAVVHEAWIKMAGHLDSLDSKRHFMAVAAKAMRQVLTDNARSGMRQKRGGGVKPVTLGDVAGVESGDTTVVDVESLDNALTRLGELNERHSQVVIMRMLGSMTMQEIADELSVGKRTVEEDWMFARTWLRRELRTPA